MHLSCSYDGRERKAKLCLTWKRRFKKIIRGGKFFLGVMTMGHF